MDLIEYFRKPHTPEQEQAAADLLARRQELRAEWTRQTGLQCRINPYTRSEISGAINGSGDGGFRSPGSTTGAANSAHLEARAVDDYDPADEFDSWLDTFDEPDGGNAMLALHGLYREMPDATPGWVHLTTRAPMSGRRTFKP